MKARTIATWVVMVLLIIGVVIKLAYPTIPEGNFGLYFAALLGVLVMLADMLALKINEEDKNASS